MNPILLPQTKLKAKILLMLNAYGTINFLEAVLHAIFEKSKEPFLEKSCYVILI